jgi:glucose-6-phosphate isomerase
MAKKSVAKHFVAAHERNGSCEVELILSTWWHRLGRRRYSMDSAIGSPQWWPRPENFRAMLEGFREMDEHSALRRLNKLAGSDGLLGLWYSSFSAHRPCSFPTNNI